ncbi:ACP S-malonyltransferase [Massilia sp. PAMC28688]|uniref:ACP S-malonyltransferase n=1 Tax=Massilia sp. PAMC28688 TaxID=2861283 RepID=UPI001C6326F5|nr:ACP S-malonyltransferase [Massilia sp. PAMC28688]QYF93467.1 ACP S-malonyltransferase [Massilia sp. PAMC28688]
MLTYIFPGQGSQARGMGADLFDAYPDMTAKADALLGYSIKELCLTDPRNELGKTQFTQPALFVVNALSYRRRLEESGKRPDFVAGHSLGEFNALLAAGCFDFETGLQIVKKRGELMSQADSGAMAAILNASKDQVEAILKDAGLDQIDLANYNSHSQVVISGAVDEIEKAQHCFKGNMMFYPLNTSGAFHSRFMAHSQKEFTAFLAQFSLGAPQIPVIANVTARPYEDGAVADTLARQIAGMVRWCESVEYLLQLDPAMTFEEVGHGEVLAKLVRSITQHVRKHAPAPVAAAPAAAAPIAPAAARPRVDAEQVVREWNSKYPVGSQVRSTMQGYDALETRTEAMVLFGHRAAVYMKGYNGYFDLTELR